ncbi:MAG: hypothetical protein AABY32_03415 [Nanoarchaeota archaeon]
MKKGKIETKNKLKIILIVFAVLALIFALILIFTKSAGKDDSQAGNEFGNQTGLNNTNAGQKISAVLYEPRYSFYDFTDPNENAFTIKVPDGWRISENSGLIRQYIDAGVLFQVVSSDNRGFFYISPYGVYTAPNDLLTFAGFPEGSYYDPSGGIAQPMLVKKYTEAEDFLREYIQQLNVETDILEVIDRPDLINENPGPLITKQSAAEISYISNPGPNQLKNKVVGYIYIIESSGIGIWASTLFGYYSPESLFNETEYLVLKSEETFKVNPEWAAKEAQEVNKRAGIISSTQDSISDIISSTFEYRSESMDRINNEWSKTILGVEEVYNSDTDETYYVDSGSNYYWIDNQNNIYGTETDENPFPLEDIEQLEIKKGV